LPPQEAIALLCHLFLSITRLLRQKSGWGMLVYAQGCGHWLASFEFISPPPKQNSFYAPENDLLLFKGMRTDF
jgi:hypothetical protein